MTPIYVGNRRILGTESSDPSGLGASDEGSVYYNSTDDKLKTWDGSAWNTVAPVLGTQSNPALSGKHLVNNGVSTSGNYWIKPTGYTGSAIECYVDMDVAGGAGDKGRDIAVGCNKSVAVGGHAEAHGMTQVRNAAVEGDGAAGAG